MIKEGYLALTFGFLKEGRCWLARCEELGTSVFGRSLQEAERLLNEAVLLHLDTLEEVGELEHFFKENNITVKAAAPEETGG